MVWGGFERIWVNGIEEKEGWKGAWRRFRGE